MNPGELISIKTPSDTNEKHTPYSAEIRLFSCIQLGDKEKLLGELEKLDLSVITGKVSDDSVMQFKYLAVSAITLATRYAIQGGLNESTAYSFSDRVISLIDGMNSREEIILCLAKEIADLTESVRKSKEQPIQSPHIKKCIRYINENIGEKITVAGLSEICGISSDYLSHIFKEEMNENLSSYILRSKLEKAKDLIISGKTNKEICVSLGLSSESHFITSFRKYYNMTPSEYYKLIK